MYYLMMMKDC